METNEKDRNNKRKCSTSSDDSINYPNLAEALGEITDLIDNSIGGLCGLSANDVLMAILDKVHTIMSHRRITSDRTSDAAHDNKTADKAGLHTINNKSTATPAPKVRPRKLLRKVEHTTAETQTDTNYGNANSKRQTDTPTATTEPHAAANATPDPPPTSEWTTVAKKTRATVKSKTAPTNHIAQTKSKPRQKPAAVLIKLAPKKSFAETVAAAKNVHIDFDELGVDGAKMKRTRTGDLLVELTGGTKSAAAAEKLRDALATGLGTDGGVVSSLGVHTDIEIVDIDAAANNDEVLEALRAYATRVNGSTTADQSITVTGLWATRVGQQVATARIPTALAKGLEKIRIGWTQCRVRPRRPPPLRCFKCHGFGHQSKDCKEIDMTAACRRCGENGHKEATCQAGGDRCVACERAGLPRTTHRPGSGACGALRQALGRKPLAPQAFQ